MIDPIAIILLGIFFLLYYYLSRIDKNTQATMSLLSMSPNERENWDAMEDRDPIPKEK